MKNNNYYSYLYQEPCGKPVVWKHYGRPVHAIDLCDAWGLDEDAFGDGDNFTFWCKYGKKHGLDRLEEKDKEIDRTYNNDYDNERELEKQIKELEEELKQIRMSRKIC